MENLILYISAITHKSNSQYTGDYQIGLTDNIEERIEYFEKLNKYETPNSFSIIKAWKVPNKINMLLISESIKNYFDKYLTPGTKWIKISEEMMISKLLRMFELLCNPLDETETFTEIKYDDIKVKKSDNFNFDKEPVKETRDKYKNMIITIGDLNFTSYTATESYLKSVRSICRIVGVDRIKKDFETQIWSSKEEVPHNSKSVSRIDNLYVNTNNGTKRKKDIIQKMCKMYNIPCKINILYRDEINKLNA